MLSYTTTLLPSWGEIVDSFGWTDVASSWLFRVLWEVWSDGIQLLWILICLTLIIRERSSTVQLFCFWFSFLDCHYVTSLFLKDFRWNRQKTTNNYIFIARVFCLHIELQMQVHAQKDSRQAYDREMTRKLYTQGHRPYFISTFS